MRFYIIDPTPREVQVEVRPTLIKAFDTTNDSFSCVLKANTVAEPYKPMTQFQVRYDDNNTQSFWIIKDSVSTFSLKPLTYKHSLTLVQHRYFLTKKLVRNTVFNQPRIKKQKLFLSTSILAQNVSFGSNDSRKAYYSLIRDGNQTSGTASVWTDKVKINPRTKVKNAYITVNMYGLYGTDVDHSETSKLEKIESIEQLTNANGTPTLKDNVVVSVTGAVSQVVEFNPFDYLNKKMANDDIKNAINNYTGNGSELDLGYAVNGIYSGVLSDTAFAYLQDTSAISVSNFIDRGYGMITLQVEVELELYNYTFYDVIDTLLKQYKLTTVDHRFALQRNQPFYLPSSGDLYDLLTTTYPPDTLSFTQATWYEALTEIFRFFDAGFKFNGNILDIEYYNDPQEKRDDLVYTARSTSHSEKGYNSGKVAYYQNAVQEMKVYSLNTESADIGVPEKEDYAIVLPKPIYDINKLTLKINQTVRISPIPGTVTLNFDLDLTHFVINSNIWATLDKQKIDLGNTTYFNYLYQETTLPFERGSNQIKVAAYYKKLVFTNTVMGQVVMQSMRRFLGITTNVVNYDVGQLGDNIDDEYYKQYFNVDYLVLNNGRATLQTIESKYNGEELVNQGNGMVDLNKIGLNILGESLKDGEPTLTATVKFSDWSKRVQEGQYIIYNGSIWVANVINTSVIANGVYQSTIEFSKNFNALSMRVKSDNEKRLTNISSEEAVMSEDSYINYIYVNDTNLDMTGNEIPLGIDNVRNMLALTFDTDDPLQTYQTTPKDWDSVWEEDQVWNGTVNIDIYEYTYSEMRNPHVVIEYEDSHGETRQIPSTDVSVSVSIIEYDTLRFKTRFNITATLNDYPYDGHVQAKVVYTIQESPKTIDIAAITSENVGLEYEDIYIPMVKYGFGNSICFELQMNHPLNAGNQLTQTSGWFGSNKYFSQATPYTDEDGWVDEITIDFYTITNYGKKQGFANYPLLQKQITLPLVGVTIDFLELLGGMWRLQYYKKPNEIFALNYQWCFLANDFNNMFIGSQFINENACIDLEKIKGKRFYLRYTDDENEKYSVLDIKGKGNHLIRVENNTNVKFQVSGSENNKVSLGIVSLESEINTKAWAIVDENNDIYFASNSPAKFTNSLATTKVITFITRQNRI